MRLIVRACLLALLAGWTRFACGADGDLLPTTWVQPQEIVPTEWDGAVDDDLGPRWTVWAGAIFLDRSDPRAQTLVRTGSTSLLDASEMQFGTAAGVDLNALRHGEVFDVDFRYFQVNDISAHERLFPPSSAELNFADFYPINCPQFDAFYNTSIQSVELNLRKNLAPRLAVLAGFRYLALDDDLGYQFDIIGDSFSLFDMHFDAINHLYGGQIGLDGVVFSRGRFQVESAIKAGVYGNDARNAVRISVLELPTASVVNRATQTAFVGDWNVSGIFQLSEHWAVRGGYQLLWVSGVALSSEQYPVRFPDPSPVSVTGDLFLHGALVSLQATW